jgi:hypothetical protein
MSAEVTRDQWATETERMCPSMQAFNAYEQLERTASEETDLDCSYTLASRGQSSYCTFTGSVAGRINIIQVYKGICQLNWRWKPKIPGLTDEQHAEVNRVLDEFRASLDGKEGKGWETVKVLRLGVDTVEEALKKVVTDIEDVMTAANKA